MAKVCVWGSSAAPSSTLKHPSTVHLAPTPPSCSHWLLCPHFPNLSVPGVFSSGEVAHFGERLNSVCTEGRSQFNLENVQITYIEDTVLSVTRAGQEAHSTMRAR